MGTKEIFSQNPSNFLEERRRDWLRVCGGRTLSSVCVYLAVRTYIPTYMLREVRIMYFTHTIICVCSSYMFKWPSANFCIQKAIKFSGPKLQNWIDIRMPNPLLIYQSRARESTPKIYYFTSCYYYYYVDCTLAIQCASLISPQFGYLSCD